MDLCLLGIGKYFKNSVIVSCVSNELCFCFVSLVGFRKDKQRSILKIFVNKQCRS